MPIRCVFFCCARAANGHTAAPPIRVTNSRRFIAGPSLPRDCRGLTRRTGRGEIGSVGILGNARIDGYRRSGSLREFGIVRHHACAATCPCRRSAQGLVSRRGGRGFCRDDRRDLEPEPLVPQFRARDDRRAVDRHRPVHGLRDRPHFAQRVVRDTARDHRRPDPAHADPDADAFDRHLDRRLVSGRAHGLPRSRLSGILVGDRRACDCHGAYGAGPRLSAAGQFASLFRDPEAAARRRKDRALDENLRARRRGAGDHAGRHYRRHGALCHGVLMMALQQNTHHIQTTHIGSLPRPHSLLDLLKAKYSGQSYDENKLNSVLTQSVADCVRKQVECGIEIVTDGEYSKPGFFTYVRERFDGYESRPNQKLMIFQQEIAAFPEYYAQYFKEAMMGGAILPLVPVACTGPVKYKGEDKLQADIANVKAAAKAAGVPDHQVFLPATAPAGAGTNEYYKTDEDYFHAVAAELNKEYRAIVAAGILLQVDDPFLSDIFVEPDLDENQKRKRAEIYVEATNAALKGIPAERVRFHTCYGINEGPRIYEANLAQVI